MQPQHGTNAKEEKRMLKSKQIYYAKTLNDIFYQKKSIKDIQLMSGCTQDKKLPEISLCVRNIRELNYSIKHERFFEFGPEITLSQILEIDPAKLPSVFYEAVKSIANTNIRNIATLAGNICAKNYRYTLFAPLVALDAKLELKSETEYYVNMAVAWLVAECFTKQREQTLIFLHTHSLNNFTINKAIQKCRDSFRVSQEDKQMLLKYKVK